MEGLLSEEAFDTNAARVMHRERLMVALNEASKDWAWKDLHRALHDARVPAGAVLDVMEALHQPGVEARYVVEEEGLKRLKTSAIHIGGFQAGTDTA
jgi:crotonobetainyl-CoA:carnitine CoA-transferase CaiB-like acyl-CoA transferase